MWGFNLKKIDQVEAKKRLTDFQNEAKKIKTNYKKKLINKYSNVLFENKLINQDKYFGRDEFFNSVIVESKNDLVGKIKKIKLLKGNHNTLFGEIYSNVNETNYAA